MKVKWAIVSAAVVLSSLLVPVYSGAGEEKVPIEGKKGQKIMVNDFFSNDKSKNAEATIINNDKMRIEYWPAAIGVATGKTSDVFSISVGGENLKEVQKNQKDAEAHLLQVLGIAETDACKLNVQIGAPKSMTGRFDYDMPETFSFCPDGKLISPY